MYEKGKLDHCEHHNVANIDTSKKKKKKFLWGGHLQRMPPVVSKTHILSFRVAFTRSHTSKLASQSGRMIRSVVALSTAFLISPK